MKQILTALVVLFFIENIKAQSFHSELTENLSNDYVTIKIWDSKKGSKYQEDQAQKDAISILLYSGLATNNEAQAVKPLLGSEPEIEKFKLIEKEFFSKKGSYSRFTKSNTLGDALPTTIGNSDLKVYHVKISRAELRKYLEEQKILNTLNNGF
jgi:hypothetical protein